MYEFFRMQALRYITLSAYKTGDWRKLQIKECGEPLLALPPDITYPYYSKEMKLTNDHSVYLREHVLERLLVARERLVSIGYDIKVYDGWRSIEVQENLFWYYMKEFTAAKFGMKDDFADLKELSKVKEYFLSLPPPTQSVMKDTNRTFVSWPSKDPGSPSPHSTGGSVDVWLYESDGSASNLGVPFDWMEDDAGTFYHLKRNRQPFKGNDKKISGNRTKMILTMADSGFSCYGPEFWHFNLGNQMDALVKGGKAKYSYIEP